MSLIFAAIYRDGNILVEYTSFEGNFEQLGLTISKKCTRGKVTYQQDKYNFHTLYDQGFVYLCMTELSYMRGDAYSFLEQLKNILYTKCPEELSKNSVAFGLQNKLRADVKAKYDLFNSPDASKIRRAQTNLDDAKDVVLQNLDKVLERSEKLELLVQKSSNMAVASSQMRSQATAIRRQQQCKRIKLFLLIGVGSVLAIYIILAIACSGFDLSGCFGGDDDSNKDKLKSGNGKTNCYISQFFNGNNNDKNENNNEQDNSNSDLDNQNNINNDNSQNVVQEESNKQNNFLRGPQSQKLADIVEDQISGMFL